MSTITTRAGKGSPLTNTEMDNNLTNLNTDKLQSGNTAASLTITSADINGGTIDGTTIGASTATTGKFTTLQTSDNIGFGVSPTTGYSLRMTKTFTGAASAYGVTSEGAVQSDVTSAAIAFLSQLNTQAAAFTLGSYSHFQAGGGAVGVGSTVTGQIAFSVTSTLTGATQNTGLNLGDFSSTTGKSSYGIISGLSTNTGTNFNIYASGSAPNYFAGNVGIGTTSPGNPLTIYKSTNGEANALLYNDNAGTATEAVFYVGNANSSNASSFIGATGTAFTTASGFVQDAGYIGSGTLLSGGLSIMTRANADMRFYTNGHTNERMRIDSSGNVGIGTTNLTDKLEVVGATTAGDKVVASFWQADTTANSSSSIWLSSGTGGNSGSSRGTKISAITNGNGAGNGHSLAFFTSANSASPTERMRIDSAGNVGIGAVPANKLQVTDGAASTTGVVRIHNPTNANDNFGAALLFSNESSGIKYSLGQISAIRTNNAANFDGALVFSSSANGSLTERMRIDSAGNVGIGTSSPSFTNGSGLFVQRSGNTAAIEVNRSDASIAGSVSLLGGSIQNNIYSVGAKPLVFYTNSTERMRIDSSGNVIVTGVGGLGYGTGSGGTVTQVTSRTTGVTLNKTNGSITLVSAAGSTTAASFTVTNSTVATTDTIIVSQRTGANLYNIMVTAVSAGSFRISLRTTGGTTTEAPVFNFAVIKSVTS